MANEYLKRTPTSTGNRKVWTVAFWHKRNATSAYNNFYTSQSSTPYLSVANFNADGTIQVCRNESATVTQLNSTSQFKDLGSWMHIMMVWDTTSSTSSDRAKLYVNGVLQPTSGTYPTQNYEGGVNRIEAHTIGAVLVGGVPYAPTEPKGEWTDYFFIDGQALTPEVFGFYKDGNGYISAGSTQATDFRNGQWVPRTPREIKNLINDNGGFGVNGFYLPMNDGSNFGADFHTTPNSIITLKGENLPQPRNGAPTTTDAYVSQLRSDPFAANLVLAVPGISTATGANLITNGTFDSNISGWTAQNAAISWDEGELHVDDSANAGNYSSANQTITTVIGKRYTMTVDIISTTGTPSIAVYSSGWSAQAGDVFYSTYSSVGKKQVIFTATSTSSTISLQTSGTTLTVYDNVVLKQEDAPRDYSADIKGSGTNKTLTANGNAGVSYEIPSYYGSALSFDGNGDYLTTTDNISDYQFGSGDFTIETWFKKDANGTVTGTYDGLAQLYNSASPNGSGTDGWFLEVSSTRGIQLYSNDGTSYNVGFDGASHINTGQWQHLAICREGTTATIFLNGVGVGINTNFAASITGGNTLRIGVYGGSSNLYFNGQIQDFRVYKGVAKYKGGFDVPKPYTPVGIESWRAVSDTCQNNFATWNPLIPSTFTYTNGNLTGTNSGAQTTASTIGGKSGKYYAEFRKPDTTHMNVGIARYTVQNEGYTGQGSSSFGIFTGQTPQRIWHSGGSTEHTELFNTAWQDTDIMMLALDLDNKKCWWGKNGQWLTGASPENGTLPHVDFGNGGSGIYHNVDFNDDDIVFRQGTSGSNGAIVNFGQNPTFSGTVTSGTYADGSGKGLFKYQPPSGFLALCEDNLPAPAIKDPGEHFKTVLYTGDGNIGRSITGVGFKPDLVWIKSRSFANNHHLIDVIRGPNNILRTSTTGAENNPGNVMTSFDSDGFTVGEDGGNNATNDAGSTFVAWCWKAGGPAVTNTDGSITSQVSANQTAGFSIVSYTGNGTVGATVGHGLGKKPKFFMTKNRDTSPLDWPVFSEELLGSNGYIYLNSSNPAATTSGISGPTSSVLTLSGYNDNNKSGDRFIAYCWAEIEGFSKFGSYVGNNSADGPFVYCGFKPAWVMIKCTTVLSNAWVIYDNARGSSNVNYLRLGANSNWVENEPSNLGDSTTQGVDFLSNGFKIRATGVNHNNSGETYIFAAFAESPFQTANAK